MRRRHQIQSFFQDVYQCAEKPRPVTAEELAARAREIAETVARGVDRGAAKAKEAASQPAAQGQPSTPAASPERRSDAYARAARPLGFIEVEDANGARGVFAVYGSGNIRLVAAEEGFGQYTHGFDRAALLAHMEGVDLPENLAALRENLRAQTGPLVRVAITPETARSAPLLDAIIRLMGPLDIRLQDGIRALLSSAQFQQLFAGDKLTQGATQLLPNFHLLGILLPQNMLAQNAEAARALLIAQGLPAALIQHIPDQALAGALNSLLLASQQAGKNPLLFLQSVASVFTLAGVPVQQVQNLLLGMLRQSQTLPLSRTGAVTPEGLERWAARLMAANNPQLLGLNQLVQENFGAGVTKILNAFIRVFFGGALMQSQMPWPQAVPNERMLAELSGLFARQHEKSEGSDSKRKRLRKRRARRSDTVEAVEHARVERKTDITDEPPLPPEMASIFIDVDSDEV